MSEPSTSELDAIANELVTVYREAIRSGAPGEAANMAALSLGRALEAIGRAKRSLHPETAYEVAVADIADAREAVSRISRPQP